MNNKKLVHVGLNPMKKSLLVVALVTALFACNKPPVHQDDLKDFKQINLVANKAKYHPVQPIDETLINGFGIAWSPTRVAWVNSVGGHVSELYSAEGARLRAINIPSPATATGGFPCGIVFSSGKGFNLPNGPAAFLFTGFDGVLSGWNGASGDNAQRLKGPFNVHTSYTGLAIGASNGRNYIYAANFGEKKINVWDTAFAPVTMSFRDPSLPSDYSPYNIQAVGDWLFVIYGKLGSDGHGVPGQGTGYVSIFNTDGSFVKRFASRDKLNLPWGVTAAPASFLKGQEMSESTSEGNKYSSGHNDSNEGVLLVGNFGDGRINVYSMDGKFLGQLQSHKHPITIEGLWALSFAPSATAPTTIDPTRLYFTAGPAQESDGVFGYLIKE